MGPNSRVTNPGLWVPPCEGRPQRGLALLWAQAPLPRAPACVVPPLQEQGSPEGRGPVLRGLGTWEAASLKREPSDLCISANTLTPLSRCCGKAPLPLRLGSLGRRTLVQEVGGAASPHSCSRAFSEQFDVLPAPRGAMTKQCGWDPRIWASALGLGRGLWVSLRPGPGPHLLSSSPPRHQAGQSRLP